MAGLNPDSKAEFRALIEHTTDIIAVIDEEGVLTYQSPSTERMLGYEPDELVGHDAFEYVHPDDRDVVSGVFSQMVENPDEHTERVEFRFRHADGSWVWIESVGTNQTHTELDGYVINSRDITERRQLEERHQHFVEFSSDVITTIDESGTIQYMSPSVERVLGYVPAEMEGEEAFEFIHPEDATEVSTEFQQGVEQTGYTATVEYRIEHADGSWVWLESRGRSLPESKSLDGRIVVNSRDVSDRKERERRLARQNERLEEFASIVSHDLRNPLRVLDGSLELYSDTGDEDHYERSRAAIDRMDQLIEDLLVLARQGESVVDPEAVSVTSMASDAWDSVESGEADLSVEAAGAIEADPGQFQRLLENLFQNAVEHGATSPDAEGRQDAVEQGRTDVTITVGTEENVLYVADDGPGIPESERGDVFEPGYSTADDGTGYGLRIVDRIADAHGWSVRVRDSRAGGARFELVGVEFADREGS